jgi:ATPase subunit of ABC transporter with duplicated ATPase domains
MISFSGINKQYGRQLLFVDASFQLSPGEKVGLVGPKGSGKTTRERAIRETNQQAAFARQQSMLAKEQRFIDRFRTHAAKAAQVQNRIKALDKIDRIELPKKRHVVRSEFRAPLRSGDQVAVIEDLCKSYGRRTVYQGFNLNIRRGERWAVMGKNGAGKTTLPRMVAGATQRPKVNGIER